MKERKLDAIKFDSIRNDNEILVLQAIEKNRTQYPEFSGSTLWLQDVYALALNKLPARYVQNMSIDLRKGKNQDDWAKKAEKAVVGAMKRVTKSPIC